MAESKTVRSLTGRQTTAGAAEETMLLVLDGAAPAASISVPLGTTVTISDVIPGGVNTTSYRIQQDNGSGFFDIALFAITGTNSGGVPTPIYTYNVGLVINGGANVAFRVRVTTPNGADLTIASMRLYTAA